MNEEYPFIIIAFWVVVVVSFLAIIVYAVIHTRMMSILGGTFESDLKVLRQRIEEWEEERSRAKLEEQLAVLMFLHGLGIAVFLGYIGLFLTLFLFY